MKPTIQFLLLAAASSGIAFGADSATTLPVGYESLGVALGFNFNGVRLHGEQLATGILDVATPGSPNTVTDNDIDLGALITGGTTYILELTDGSGIIQEVTSATGTALNVADLLTVPASYTLRRSATLESVFGSAYTPSPDGITPGTLDSGLTIGFSSPGGADQIWFWNGVDFTEYYFDEWGEPYGGGFNGPGWVNLDSSSTPIDPTKVNLVYADSFMIVSASGNDVVVTGEVKKTATELNLVDGFNFVGSVAPAGATLESAFGSTYTPSPDGIIPGTLDSGLSIGFSSPGGADQIWFWNGIDFTEYYFDEWGEPYGGGFNGPGWVNLDSSSTPIDPATIVLPSGYIITAAGAKNVLQSVPSFYAGF